LNGKEGRARRLFVLQPGRDPDNPANWQTTRLLRRQKPRLSFEAARALGWQIALREAKHVYAVHVGRDRKAWRAALACPSYPAPRPELKLRARAATESAEPSRVQTIGSGYRLTPPARKQLELFQP
jgi:hypothetical protein